LRQFNGHSQAVRAVRFLPNNTHVVSASDDCSVRVWDIPSQSVVCTWEQEHTDHVRSLAVSHDNANLIISGSYDHTVKVWDIRTRQAVLTLKHGSPNGSSYPVEALLVFPGDSVILSAGGNQLRTWDILGGTGGRLLNVASNHQKTITSMCFGTDYSRVLTASLDQQVKVYDVTDYHVVHSFKCPSPLLSIAVSPNDSHIVTGTVSGLLSVRERHILAEDQRTMKRFRHRSVVPVKTSSNFSFFLKGSQRVSTNTELFVKEDRKLRISQYEHLLRRFQYGEALDAAVKVILLYRRSTLFL
jgi:U3 small nucleolar RNA-associated protein 15